MKFLPVIVPFGIIIGDENIKIQKERQKDRYEGQGSSMTEGKKGRRQKDIKPK